MSAHFFIFGDHADVVMKDPETGNPTGLGQFVDDMEEFFGGEDVCYECGRPLDDCLEGKCP